MCDHFAHRPSTTLTSTTVNGKPILDFMQTTLRDSGTDDHNIVSTVESPVQNGYESTSCLTAHPGLLNGGHVSDSAASDFLLSQSNPEVDHANQRSSMNLQQMMLNIGHQDIGQTPSLSGSGQHSSINMDNTLTPLWIPLPTGRGTDSIHFSYVSTLLDTFVFSILQMTTHAISFVLFCIRI